MVHYNKRAHPQLFHLGNMVLRRVFENTTEIRVGKVQPNWDGPYVVYKMGGGRPYHLQTLDGTPQLHH